MYNVGLGREPSSRKAVLLQSPPGCTLSGVAAPPPNARGWKPGSELEVLSVPALVLAATQPVRLFVLRVSFTRPGASHKQATDHARPPFDCGI